MATDSSANITAHWLSVVDEIIFGLALVVAVVVAAWWLAFSRRDPLQSAPPRPNSLAGDSLALAAAVYLAAAILIGSVMRGVMADPEGPATQAIVGGGAQIAGVAMCFLIARDRFEGGIRKFFVGGGSGARRKIRLTILGTLLAVGICPLILQGSVWVWRQLAPDYVLPVHPTIEALHVGTATVALRAMLWISAVIVAPLAEEAFFRGLLQTVLATMSRNRWFAIAGASALFAVVHYSQPQALPALIALALVLGYAYERTGSLVPPILIHALFNLKTLLWDALGGWPEQGV